MVQTVWWNIESYGGRWIFLEVLGDVACSDRFWRPENSKKLLGGFRDTSEVERDKEFFLIIEGNTSFRRKVIKEEIRRLPELGFFFGEAWPLWFISFLDALCLWGQGILELFYSGSLLECVFQTVSYQLALFCRALCCYYRWHSYILNWINHVFFFLFSVIAGDIWKIALICHAS